MRPAARSLGDRRDLGVMIMFVLDVILGLAVLALLIYRQLSARPVNASALRLFVILLIVGVLQTY